MRLFLYFARTPAHSVDGGHAACSKKSSQVRRVCRGFVFPRLASDGWPGRIAGGYVLFSSLSIPSLSA